MGDIIRELLVSVVGGLVAGAFITGFFALQDFGRKQINLPLITPFMNWILDIKHGLGLNEGFGAIFLFLVALTISIIAFVCVWNLYK